VECDDPAWANQALGCLEESNRVGLVYQDVSADGYVEARKPVICFDIVARKFDIPETTVSDSLPRGIDDPLITVDADDLTGRSDVLCREHRHIAGAAADVEDSHSSLHAGRDQQALRDGL
jgi:hypothetical protein